MTTTTPSTTTPSTGSDKPTTEPLADALDGVGDVTVGPAADAPAAAVDPTAFADLLPVGPTPLVRSPQGQVLLFPDRDGYPALLAALHHDGFELLSDLCGVDYLTHPGRSLPAGVEAERFEVVVNLRSVSSGRQVRIRVQVPEHDPRIVSAWSIYPGSEAMEREAFDMFGLIFDGHPDLTRILLPEDWEGHPLRKDYGVGRVPVQFKESPGPR